MGWDHDVRQVECPYCHHTLDIEVEVSADVNIDSIGAIDPHDKSKAGPTIGEELVKMNVWNSIMAVSP